MFICVYEHGYLRRKTSYGFSDFGVFHVPNTSETLQKQSQSILLIQEMNLKKNPIEKYFFVMEKNDFENFDFQKKSEISIFSIEKLIFSI